MSKSIKLKDSTYIDSSSIMHNRNLLSTLMNRGYVFFNYVGPNKNLNDYTDFGLYWFTSNLTNAPTTWIYVLVIGRNSGDTAQLALSVAGDPKLYIRNQANGVWKSWREI